MKTQQSIRNRRLIGLSVLLLGFLTVFFYAQNHPSTMAWYPKCWFRIGTGLLCFGCGTGRSIYYMLHFQVLEALHHNLFTVLISPFLVYSLFQKYMAFCWQITLPLWRLPRPILIGIPTFLIIFVILRNIPYFPFTWLAPPPFHID